MFKYASMLISVFSEYVSFNINVQFETTLLHENIHCMKFSLFSHVINDKNVYLDMV